MIVKVVRAGNSGSERALCRYVLDLQHDQQTLDEYEPIRRDAKEKVLWARTANTGVDHPRFAVQAIADHNRQNTRPHAVSRMEHVVISFGHERPTREQMVQIEDRLMEKIGFGDHPRVSAVHENSRTDPHGGYMHLHIAVSRIDPTTLKAEHPRHNHFSLQAEAARLELDLGLKLERKTLLPREQQEIELRRELRERGSLDRAQQQQHAPARQPSYRVAVQQFMTKEAANRGLTLEEYRQQREAERALNRGRDGPDRGR